MPPTAKQYTQAGLPWFDYYDRDAVALEGAKRLKDLNSVAEMGEQKREQPLPENRIVEVQRIITLRRKGAPDHVRELTV